MPEGVWRLLPASDAVPEAKVRPAFVGARVIAHATIPSPDVRATLDQVEISERPHPLPFADEQDDRAEFEGDVEHADEYVAAQPTDARAVLALAREKLATGFAASRPSRIERAVFSAERAAPPRIVPLTEGMVAAVKRPVELTTDPPPLGPPRPDSRIAPPRLRALLRSTPPAEVRGAVQTTVSRAAAALPRVPAPTLVEARTAAAARAPTRLILTAPRAAVGRGTVLAADAGPPTTRAGGSMELRPGLLADEDAAAALGKLESALADGEPVPLTAGDLLVWELPNAEHDSGEVRPVLTAVGDQLVRLVVVDRAGDVLADATGDELRLSVPRGAHRIAAAGLGVPPASAKPSGLAGWHAATRLRPDRRRCLPWPRNGRPLDVASHPAGAKAGGRGGRPGPRRRERPWRGRDTACARDAVGRCRGAVDGRYR